MDKELIETLSNLLDEKLKPIQDDIKDMKYSQTRFEDNQARLEKKIDSVVNQTVDLTKSLELKLRANYKKYIQI